MERPLMRAWTAGVDFGGTNVKVGLVDGQGRVARTEVLATAPVARPARFVDAVGAVIESLAAAVGTRPARLRGVGVGAPGAVDVARGIVHSTVNVPGWREVPLARLLERRLRCRCVVDNDANLVTLGEWRFGAGRGSRALVCLTVGTGVGGGLLLDGRLYRGAAGAAGEIGHMVIDPRGTRCNCGRRGCLEAHVNAAAIRRLGRRALRRGRGVKTLRALLRRAQGRSIPSPAAGARVTPELLAQAATSGDAAATAVWEEVGHRLGVGVANVVNLLNPDRVVIGGGIGAAWPLFAPALTRTVRDEAFPVASRAVRIVPARLGQDAGIVGAAVLVWNTPARR